MRTKKRNGIARANQFLSVSFRLCVKSVAHTSRVTCTPASDARGVNIHDSRRTAVNLYKTKNKKKKTFGIGDVMLCDVIESASRAYLQIGKVRYVSLAGHSPRVHTHTHMYKYLMKIFGHGGGRGEEGHLQNRRWTRVPKGF